MPVHDWTKVNAGVFHDFHQRWIISIANSLNGGLLPRNYYAMAEQVAMGPIPDVITVERQDLTSEAASDDSASGGTATLQTIAVVDHPPKVHYSHRMGSEPLRYAAKANRIAIRHSSGDVVVGYIEIISPGNKHGEFAIRNIVEKMGEAIERGCHLLIIDLHPPTPRDPRGIHALFCTEQFTDTDSPGVTDDKPLGMSAYQATLEPQAYFEPFAVGDKLIDMPAFLTPKHYVNVPMEATYLNAWNGVPSRWKEVIEA